MSRFASHRGGRVCLDHTNLPQLTALGIQPQSISFQNLTLESDHFICVYVLRRERWIESKHS